MSGQFRSALRVPFYLALGAGLFLSGLGIFGAWHVALDATNHFRPHFIAFSAIGLGLAWFVDGKKALAGAAACLVLNLAIFAAFLPDRAPDHNGSDQAKLSLATFNVWGRNKQLDRLETFLRERSPDVVVLQEVRPKMIDLLDGLRDIYPYQTNCAAALYCGLALLSKHPIDAPETLIRQPNGTPIVRARVLVPSNSGPTPLTVIGTHFQVALPYLNQFQDKQHLIEYANSIEGNKVIVGDFNATPWSHVVHDIAARTETKLIHRFLPTWPAIAIPAQFPIDHIFVSDGISYETVRRDHVKGSDHRPIVAEMKVSRDHQIANDLESLSTDASAKVADRLP